METFDQLNIDTPEQIALELPLAGVGSRFLAIAIDTLIQFALYLIVGLVFIFTLPVGSSVLSFLPRLVGPAMAIFILFAIYWGYFAVFETLWKGQTPGKRYAGIRVIKESGRPINAFEAIGRNLMRAVDGMPGIYGVGLVVMMLNRQNRRLGDFVAGTVVVHEKPTEEIRPTWNTATAEGSAGSALSQVTADELVLIETYLSRRWELDSEVRLRTAIQIADRIKARTGLQPQGHQHVDEFLEEAARQIRDSGRFQS
ncbi:MAG TPA: RDD family protein [Candidatus Sulfotelmatobacter sp.]|nr:RDD family protein [Candidatus Sulfotelmatobacter sp.]